MESGHLVLESIDFDLGEVLDKTLEMMAIRAHEKGLELALRIARRSPPRWSAIRPGCGRCSSISLATPSSSRSKAR